MDILEETSFRSEPGSSDCSLDEVLTFSPDLGLSPVTSASSKMGHLNCANRLSHITPRRKLKLSPDSRNTSPTDSTSQNQANMENVTLSGFPKESTPKLKERNLGTEASDSSFETYISKPKKPIRRTILRNNEENATLPGARKKKSRKKLSVMFQCPEEQQKPWPEKGKLAEGTLKNNRTSDSVAILEKLSVNDESPKAFVAASGNSDLIGDFSKPYSLPVQKGKHDDLKYISCGTLVDLISGVYNDVVRRYKVVDCRYPYEYAGGHIQGSWNLYSEEHIRDNFIMHPPLPEKRIIVIFHCEFSSKRGPKLCRSLRNMDRNINKYPYLHYPELYLLKGGYKEFYEKFKSLCVPQAYVNMLHSDYREEYRKFYRICKTGAKRKIRKELLKTQSPHKSTRSETTRTAIIDMIEN